MKFKEHLKNKILQLCGEKNMSVNKLAILSGLTQSTVASILAGKSNSPRVGTLQKLAKGFDVDFIEFMKCIYEDGLEFDDDEQ